MSTVKLQSSDGKIFKADLQAVIKCSGTIRAMLEDCDDDEEVMMLPNVDSTILSEILKWANHHKDDAVPSDDDDAPTDDDGNEKKRTELPPWDANFLKVDQGTLVMLMLAASYLDIRGLIEDIALTIANMMKGKSVEEIRETFNIVGAFMPAEEDVVRKENE